VKGAGEVPAVGALGSRRLSARSARAALGCGRRGDGLELGVVLLAEGVALAGGVSRARPASARASGSAWPARAASCPARRAASDGVAVLAGRPRAASSRAALTASQLRRGWR